MFEDSQTIAWIVFWTVAGARFLIPLLIPRYPFPGILASLVLDGVDQTIFQAFPSLDLTFYQGYDKALDIYYLTIAYISTLRNWENHFAFQVSRFLFYWRLVGVALFEITQARFLLLLFPNTFEYFFIFYEAVSLAWDPQRLSKKALIGVAALIWVVVKLPQEYWIHISQTDTTDWLKVNLFKAPVESSWGLILRSQPGVFVALILAAVLVLAVAWWAGKRWLPPADRRLNFSADAPQSSFKPEQVRQAQASFSSRVVDMELFEKIVLVTLVSLCFAHVLPGVRASDFELAIGVALVIVVNTALSHWLSRRHFGWYFSAYQFGILFVANLGVLLVYALLRSWLGSPVRMMNILFFVFIFTLLVTLFDRYRQVYLMRFGLVTPSNLQPAGA